MLVAGVDVGGTKVLAAMVGEDGTILRRWTVDTDPGAGTSSLLGALDALVSSGDHPAAVGVAAAGWVEHGAGKVVFAPNLRYEDTELRKAVESRYGVPVAVENDASAAAWGERKHGAGGGAQNMCMVTVGTGIGGGIITGGELYRGGRGFAAEVGHMVILDGGPLCACGQRGCLEAMASGTAIGRMARERSGEPGAQEVLRTAGGDPANITGAIVTKAAENGDAFATAILETTGGYLGVGLANLVHLLDPEVIVVGGGAAVDNILGPARAEMEKRVEPSRPPPPVVRAALGNEAGVIGAAAIARSLLVSKLD